MGAAHPTLRHRLRAARVGLRRRVHAGRSVRIGAGVRVEVARGGRLVLGDGCAIGDATVVLVRGGEVRIGPGAWLGDRCRLIANAGIELGAGCVLAPEVAIIDTEHETGDVEVPVRLQGIVAEPVRIGPGAVLDAGAAILCGATVGANARVGARSVVRRDVPAGAEARGVPARVM